MRLFLLMLICVTMVGCGEITSTPIEMVIIEVQTDNEWGCANCDYKTIFRSTDGRTDMRRGDWGEPGDIVSGWWVEGHWEYYKNGFRLKR